LLSDVHSEDRDAVEGAVAETYKGSKRVSYPVSTASCPPNGALDFHERPGGTDRETARAVLASRLTSRVAGSGGRRVNQWHAITAQKTNAAHRRDLHVIDQRLAMFCGDDFSANGITTRRRKP